MKVERVSYEVITPSAARGILEAIYWKPEIRWTVDRLTVLNPIRFTSIRRNEVSAVIPAGKVRQTMEAATTGDLGLYVEDERQQRGGLLLRDVAYVIDAHFDVRTGDLNPAKHIDQFRRRALAGQCFTRPYLGCREYAAHFRLLENASEVPPIHPALRGERDLGLILHDFDFAKRQPAFFQAIMRDGAIQVPTLSGGQP